MLRRVRGRNGQEGQALVETTLMILVVLLLLMGIIEFGFLFFTYVRVSNAAREGARAGSLWSMYPHSTLCEHVESSVKGEVEGCTTEGADKNCDIVITLDDGPVDCSSGDPDLEAGEPITVTVDYDFELPFVSGLPIARDIFSSPYLVSRAVVMRVQ
ncbi:MAG: hypothetical protein GTO63_20390 [Anaerolineae bacterium]|nr:hypothetical protein [Anaerolineae bacterium]NIN97133.1 hypothetical protein [Anaerolineae bacterium]NIQ80106.1 hypothetical protein [Anaerolineae bacterium]